MHAGASFWSLRVIAIVFALCVTQREVSAQSLYGELKGRVVDAGSNFPLPGATVMIRGTNYGAASDLNGYYVIRSVPPGKYPIQARFVGYQSESRDIEILSGETSTSDFALSITAIQFDEVVVTGTAVEAERRTLGNTISTINTRDFGYAPVSNLSQVLQGRAPGVVALLSSGQVGAGASLRIRGMTSVTQDNEPIVYVDGVRVDNYNGETHDYSTGGQRPSRLNDISPSSIERIEIIKGASATTLYGTQASNGVISIQTKRGLAGAPQVSFQVQRGWQNLPVINVGQIKVTQSLLDSLTRKNVNLADYPHLRVGADAVNSLRRTGAIEAYETSLRGGNEFARYFASGRFEKETGAIPSNSAEHYSFAGNLDADVTEGLKVTFNSHYSNYDLQRPFNDNSIFGLLSNAYWANMYNARPGRPWGEGFTSLEASSALVSLQNVDRFTGSMMFEYRPFATFTNRLTLGTDVVNEENTRFFPYGMGYLLYPTGQKVNHRRSSTRITIDYAGSYRGDLTEDMSWSVTAGGQLFFDSDYQVTATGQNFPAPGVSTVSAAATRLGLESRIKSVNGGYFAQGQLGWQEKIFLTGGSRFDRNSTFGKDYGTQIYPKAGLSYIISEEFFWPKDIIDNMKLRMAYGTSGKQPATYAAQRTFDAISALNGVPAVSPGNLGDPNLKPEVSQEYEYGFDAAIFNSRIGFEVTLFHQTTHDALVNISYPPSRGFLLPQLGNVGQVKNTGIEIGLRTIAYRSEDLDVTFNATLSTMNNEVKSLGSSAEIPFAVNNIGKIKPGYPILSFFGQRVVGANTVDTFSVTNKYGTPILSPEEFLGQSVPKFTGSVSVSVTLFSSFTISAGGDWATGHVVGNGTKWFASQASYNAYEPLRAIRELLDRSGPAAVTGQTRRELQEQYQRLNPTYLSNFIEKGDFFKLRELALTFNVPATWAGALSVRSMNISFAARNLATWTRYGGADPEVNYGGQQDFTRGQDFATVPQVRRYVGTLHIGL